MHNPSSSFSVEYKSLIRGIILLMQVHRGELRSHLFIEAEIDVEIASYTSIKTQKSIQN